jgi:hypothetical protein
MRDLGSGGCLSTNATSEVDITSHNGDTLAVDGTEIDILEERDEVCLGSLLEGSNSGALETEVSLAVLSNLTNETLEGELADQKLSGLLVTTDLTESDGTGAITMGLLDSTSGGGGLAGSLGGNHLTGSLTTSRFASSLLGTSHVVLSLYDEVGAQIDQGRAEFIPATVSGNNKLQAGAVIGQLGYFGGKATQEDFYGIP